MREKTPRNKRRIVWMLLLAGMAIILFWAGIKAWRVYQAGNSLLNRQDQARTLLAEGLTDIDAFAAEALVFGVRHDVVTLRDELNFLMPFLPYLKWLPRVGPLAASAPYFMEMADAGTEAAAYSFRAAEPVLLLMQDETSDDPKLPQALQILEAAQPDLARASLAMDRVVEARDGIDNQEELPWRVRTLLELADEWLPLADGGLKVSLVLPDMLGLHQPRRYLIIAQNEDELRATGGFISGAGLIEVDRGRISKLEFQDANSVDAWAPNQVLTKPYGEPPQPMAEMMLLDLFLFRDANFWPHYPISAEKAMDLYSYGRGVPPLDGALAIDQEFIRLLVAGTGPVSIADIGTVINEGNAISSLQNAWTLEEGVGQRKAFLSVFAQAIRNRLENELSGVDPVNLMRQIGTALAGKDLQVHVREPLTSAILAETGWDGSLTVPEEQDALMVVDSNMGYNKANLFMQRSLSYHVQLAADGSAVADLTVTHQHTGEDDGEPCWQGTLDEYRAGAEYLALTNKCYWNYLRIYVPEGSRLINGPQHLVPGETWYGGYDWDAPTEVSSELFGFTTFANFMLVPKASTLTSEYRYELPNVVASEDGTAKVYQLNLYKQAGTASQPTEISVTLPANARLAKANPQPSRIEGETLVFNVDLDSDQVITIVYE